MNEIYLYIFFYIILNAVNNLKTTFFQKTFFSGLKRLRKTAACICMNEEFERPGAVLSVSLPYFLFLFCLAAVESIAEGHSAI